MLSVDFPILNVALPEVGAGTGLGLTGLPWIASAYALPAAGFALVFGRMTDLLGRRRLFLSGMVLLIAASLLGGTLVSLLSWRAAFFVNVPVAVVILVLTPLIGESRAPGRVRLDLPGAVTVSGGLLAVIYAVIEKDLPAALLGVVSPAAFWVIELRSPAPLAPVRVLRRPTVTWGNHAGLGGLRDGARDDLLDHALPAADPGPVPAGHRPGLRSAGPGGRGRRRHRRTSPRAPGQPPVLTGGLAVQGLATLPLVFLGDGRVWLAVLVPALFAGFFGHVSSIVAYTVTATSGLPDEEQGLATGLTTMTQQVAISVGIPVLGAVAAARGTELPGIHPALGADVAVTLLSVALIWFGLRPRRGPAALAAEEGAGGPLAVPADRP